MLDWHQPGYGNLRFRSQTLQINTFCIQPCVFNVWTYIYISLSLISSANKMEISIHLTSSLNNFGRRTKPSFHMSRLVIHQQHLNPWQLFSLLIKCLSLFKEKRNDIGSLYIPWVKTFFCARWKVERDRKHVRVENDFLIFHLKIKCRNKCMLRWTFVTLNAWFSN